MSIKNLKEFFINRGYFFQKYKYSISLIKILPSTKKIMAKKFCSKYVKNAKFLRILKVRGSVLKVRGSVLKSMPRFGRFEVRLPKVREVRGSEFPGSTQH